ncbi:hypothetical protein like AT1G74830 [Hibiscus trionum]|uniref:GTD-binding domain-containing protein n=1 Tax=Hibiscus trionum TaxID=183268 RepID=A0A9W7MXQ0_HIBTR|nr:hypothetical protein like AT1G74830 [Hibiscus trionum]
MGKRSFKQFVEQELGSVPKFFVYAVLEWIMIFMLFIGGFVASIANGFAKIFDLPVPCLVCTRLDHLFFGTTNDFHFNDSICDSHKKSVSCLAFCHAHKKLSDIRHLCEGCLLSFATERETDCDRYKSLLGILHKDIDQLLVEEDNEVQLSLPAGAKKDEDPAGLEKSKEHRCTCCGQPLNVKSTGSKEKYSSLSSLAPSPPHWAAENPSHVKYSEPEFKPDESEAPEDHDRSRGLTPEKPLKEDGKPMAAEGDEEDKTPNYTKNNKFFGIPLSESENSPRWARTPRKLLLQRSEFAAECNGEGLIPNSPRMDRKSLMALYMELDEERSASAVAAYNAMAMITRLQAEKAAVQMEALQYQRMMEEQAEYDQETLEEMTNLVAKREEELCELEAELEVYRAKYGRLTESDFEKHGQRDENDEGNNNNNSQTVNTASLSAAAGGKPETASTATTGENSETRKDQSESNSSNAEKVGAAEAAVDKPKKVGTDSDPTAEKTAGETTAKAKKAMRQMDRMKILEKKMHITSVGRFQRQNSEIDEDFEEDH